LAVELEDPPLLTPVLMVVVVVELVVPLDD